MKTSKMHICSPGAISNSIPLNVLFYASTVAPKRDLNYTTQTHHSLSLSLSTNTNVSVGPVQIHTHKRTQNRSSTNNIHTSSSVSGNTRQSKVRQLSDPGFLAIVYTTRDYCTCAFKPPCRPCPRVSKCVSK